MSEANMLERIVRTETKIDNLETKLLEFKQQNELLERTFAEQLKKHTEEEQRAMACIMAQLNTITMQTANFKSTLGGVLLAVTSIWVVLSQLFSWLHLDIFKLLSTALNK